MSLDADKITWTEDGQMLYDGIPYATPPPTTCPTCGQILPKAYTQETT